MLFRRGNRKKSPDLAPSVHQDLFELATASLNNALLDGGDGTKTLAAVLTSILM
jgi:hypothetical protein